MGGGRGDRQEPSDGAELAAPGSVVEERTEVEAVVVWSVPLRVVAGGQRRHLVAIYGVKEEEPANLWMETTAIMN
jgi:hypothetical protein